MDKNDQANKNETFVGVNGEVTGLGFANRDEGAKNQEDQGVIEFVIIRNDENHESMRRLLDLKNIFSRQLPKMPKDYIVKLVFDKNHQAMIIQKNGSKVIGGICYRMYPTQRFTQVAFLAITAVEQVKGYGTRLMNKFKEQMQRKGIEYLMTYADNFALGYFRKQGFTKDHRMSTERWKGYIKDYEGGTMMECYIHPRLDYSRVSEIIKQQKNYVIEKIKQLSINQKKFDGQAMQNLSSPFVRKNNEGVQEEFQYNPQQIPGVVEGGWTWAQYDELKKTKERSFQIQCQNIIESMKKHKSAWPFIDPVQPQDVPDYLNVIKQPMDIKTMQKKLMNNEYENKESFLDDINKIFNNCRLYNQQDTVYYKCSLDLQDYVNSLIVNLKDRRDEPGNRERKGGKSKSPRKRLEKKKL